MIEIKGFWWGNDKMKMRLVFNQNPYLRKKLIVIGSRLYNLIMKDDKKFFEMLRYLS